MEDVENSPARPASLSAPVCLPGRVGHPRGAGIAPGIVPTIPDHVGLADGPMHSAFQGTQALATFYRDDANPAGRFPTVDGTVANPI